MPRGFPAGVGFVGLIGESQMRNHRVQQHLALEMSAGKRGLECETDCTCATSVGLTRRPQRCSDSLSVPLRSCLPGEQTWNPGVVASRSLPSDGKRPQVRPLRGICLDISPAGTPSSEFRAHTKEGFMPRRPERLIPLLITCVAALVAGATPVPAAGPATAPATVRETVTTFQATPSAPILVAQSQQTPEPDPGAIIDWLLREGARPRPSPRPPDMTPTQLAVSAEDAPLVAKGREFFNDTKLSGDGKWSCSSCHPNNAH